jgi:hypothetical protein
MRLAYRAALALLVAAAPQAAQAGKIVQKFGSEFSGVLGFDKTLGHLDYVTIQTTIVTDAEYEFEPFPEEFKTLNGFSKTIALPTIGFAAVFPTPDPASAPVAWTVRGERHQTVLLGSQPTQLSVPTLAASKTYIVPYTDPGSPFPSPTDQFVTDGYVNFAPTILENRLIMQGFAKDKTTKLIYVDPKFFYYSYLGTVTYVYSNAVPEPASWAMLVLGFGSVGAAMRRRPTQRPVACKA